MNLTMSHPPLESFGWKDCFEQQLSEAESAELTIARVAAHLGNQVLCLTVEEEFSLPTVLTDSCGGLAVGDWILLDRETRRGVRRLKRESLIARKSPGNRAETQLIAANVDTLFVVTSCNHDFNPSRLERYLAMAVEAHVHPVVILTKSDLCQTPETFRVHAAGLMRGLVVESVDARERWQAEWLSRWCGIGQTVALVGSSGVGKSTLAMSLGASELATSEIRQDDSKGRHTTTARSIHQLDAGGLLIDTPGMRELQLTECEQGVAEVFDEILEVAKSCKFRDCSHLSEPGCAVLDAIEKGQLDARRLTSFRKLQSEQARNARSIRELRHESRKRGQFYKSVVAARRDRRQRDQF
jgi:ribosome biogenesis GTPase